MTKDEKYISRCLQLARNGLCTTAPNPMVGAVIVRKDTIIGEGYHIRCGESHAEVNAIRSGKRRKSFKGINPLCEPRALLSLRENTALRRPYYRERHSQSRCRMYGPLLFSCRTRYR